MKKNKWTRLGLGVCLLGMLFIFQGTSADHLTECALCFIAEANGVGYLEINNNTPYNILVLIRGGKKETSALTRSKPLPVTYVPICTMGLTRSLRTFYHPLIRHQYITKPTPSMFPLDSRLYP